MGIDRVIPPLRRLKDERDAAREKADRQQGRIARLKRRNAALTRSVEQRELAIDRLKADLDAFRNPATEPRTDTRERRYVFVMAHQRSGSTLLQSILNSIPGYLVRGENGGLLSAQYDFHRRALRQKEIRAYGADNPGAPFFGISDYPEEQALAGIRDLVTRTLLRPLPDSRVLGFKEVNWRAADLDGYVDFYRQVFPGARFVCNTRKIEDSARSRWFAEREDAVEFLSDQQEQIRHTAERLGDDAFALRYDDYVDDPSRLAPLFEWLGADLDLARIAQVMSIRYA